MHKLTAEEWTWKHQQQKQQKLLQSNATRVMVVNLTKLECGPMPNVMAALPNIGGALCSTPQCLADAQY